MSPATPRLKAMGFWGSPSDEEPGLRHPAAFVDLTWERSEREEVAAYLRAGHVVAAYMGYSTCRFACGISDEQMGSTELSDGVWVWPEGLAHYVIDHSVRLPYEFVERSRRNRSKAWAPPDGTDQDDYDLDFWLAWCAENANPDPRYLRAEQAARQHYLETVRRQFDEFVHKAEREYGVGNERCMWRDCDRPAMKDSAICSWHHVSSFFHPERGWGG